MNGFPPTRVALEGEGAGSYLPRALRALRRLVGRAQIGGVDTLSETFDLDDGVTVDIKTAGSVKQLRIKKREGAPPINCLEVCSIYMETGALDLGANSETDLVDQPTVDDSVPQLYFGDNEDCGKGPQGRMTIFKCEDQTSATRSGCQSGENPRESKACTGVDVDGASFVTLLDKKTCQARLQPSLWTGLMQRWVQAMYGNPKAAYKCLMLAVGGGIESPYLRVWDKTLSTSFDIRYTWVPHTGENYDVWGLIDLGRCNYRFVKVLGDGSGVSLYEGDLTKCGQKLAGIVSRMKSDTVKARRKRDKLESYLLSQLTISTNEPVTIEFETPVEDFPLCYSWKFNPRSPEMAMVIVYGTSSPKSKTVKRIFSIAEDGSVVITEDDSAELDISLFGGIRNAIVIPCLDNRSSVDGNLKGFTGNFINNHIAGPMSTFDAPIYCWYLEDGSLEIIRAAFTIESQSYTPSDACYGDTTWLPGFNGTCDGINSPCMIKSSQKYTSASVGFYSGRASCVVVTSFGVNPTSGNFSSPYHTNYEATELTVTWYTTPIEYKVSPISMKTTTSPPAGSGGTFCYSFPCLGIDASAQSTSTHGCTYFNGTTSVCNGDNAGEFCVSCPDLGSRYECQGPILHTGGGDGNICRLSITATPRYGYPRVDWSAGYSLQDINSALLIVPAGSASAAFLMNTYINRTSGSSGKRQRSWVCDSAVHCEFDETYIAGVQCSYYDNVEETVVFVDGSIASSTAPSDQYSIGNGKSSFFDCRGLYGWANDGHNGGAYEGYLPSFTEVLEGVNGETGNYGISGSLIGFYASSVKMIDSYDGIFGIDLSSFQTYMPSCMTAPDNLYYGETVDQLSVFMDQGNNWPEDAEPFYLVSETPENLVTSTSVGVRPAMFVHTSAGGDMAYFNDWPSLRATLADNSLTMTGGYPAVFRPQYVGWA